VAKRDDMDNMLAEIHDAVNKSLGDYEEREARLRRAIGVEARRPSCWSALGGGGGASWARLPLKVACGGAGHYAVRIVGAFAASHYVS